VGGRLQAMILSLSGIDDIVGACDEDRLFLFVSARQRGFTDRMWRDRLGARRLLHSYAASETFFIHCSRKRNGSGRCLSACGNLNV